MIIGFLKENKHNEFRVAAIPSAVSALTQKGHTVYVEHGAGVGSGFSDQAYIDAGGQMTEKKEVYAKAELLYKVKEIKPSEYDMLRSGQAIFTYLHSNAHFEMTKELLDRGVIGIAYEDVDDHNYEFPLLSPMSISRRWKRRLPCSVVFCTVSASWDRTSSEPKYWCSHSTNFYNRLWLVRCRCGRTCSFVWKQGDYA